MKSIKSKKKIFITTFVLIFLCLFAINLYLYLFGTDYKLSFSQLFQTLADAPRIDTNFISLQFESGITADWHAFNFVRDFINGLWSIVGVVLYVCVQIANSFVFLFELIKSLFVGVLG